MKKTCFLIISCFYLIFPISAQEAYVFKEVYEIKTDIKGSDRDSISTGMKDAFKHLIVSVSGNSEILKNEKVIRTLRKPEVFINEYRLNTLDNESVEAIFSFNGKVVRKFFYDNGLPLWVGSTLKILGYFPCRFNISSPEPLLHQERCLKLTTNVKNISALRVLNLVEPSMDLYDLEIVEILEKKSDVAVLNKMARRYGLEHWLSCSIYDSLGVLLEDPNCISSVFPSTFLELNESITSLVDTLTKEYQLVIDPNIKSRSMVTITGVEDHVSLGLVKDIIDSQAIVVNSKIKSLEGSKVIFSIDLIGKPSDLMKLMEVNAFFSLNSEDQRLAEAISYSFVGES